ncbi:MAG: S41 family peptidase, partial [Bryobacterales bacterium]|nr:S41 family peptidase [Bryobacterales bacterium]
MGISRRWTILLIAVAMLLCSHRMHAQDRLGMQTRQETFQLVWKTVHDRYFDPSFGGLDWNAIRDEFQPLALQAADDAAFYSVLQQMVDRLGQSHFQVMPPFWLSTRQIARRGSASAGIQLALVAEQAVVWRIRSESSADLPALRSGCVLHQAGEIRMETLRADLQRQGKDSRLASRLLLEAASVALTGPFGQQLDLRFQCGDAPLQSGAITLRGSNAERSEQLGLMPPMDTEFEVQRLPGDIVVVRFNLFVMTLLPRIRSVIQQAAADGAKGLIFDVRGNPGGIGAMANGLAGYLVKQRVSLGAMRLRGTELKFLAFPQDSPYLGPVAVLIDGASASTSEIFAAGLQELGRAIVVGERSMGAALPSFFMELP